MEDIQFWLYLLFAAIYFITRGLKKKDSNKNQKRPASKSTETKERPQRKPVSFEELLQEFTEGKKPEPKPEEVESDYQTVDEIKEEEREQPFEEGRTRRFSDDESKRIYEESIARAEGSKLEFKRDEHFKSKLQSTISEEEESGVASEIRDLLSNPEDARKAVVLSEILNRKY